MRRYCKSCLALLFGVVLFSFHAQFAVAQATTSGAILGVVRDVQNAVVPGVAITVRNVETGITRHAVSDGSGRPYRMRVRAPSFVHASVIPRLCEGSLVADVIANIGTVDIVLGECDR